ncbi:AP-3 complex subunit beta-1 [Boothiomyces macroporosus]|uniref:AP-3 complex subunit beta-1 n=1 Tax=Boothiomyces macroporosus TaxID=261099 RepID=A0AAD5Y8E5_9FUNG|nr:AP-3 complex subunit beta-1 [Boothiomyces macroporosus]
MDKVLSQATQLANQIGYTEASKLTYKWASQLVERTKELGGISNVFDATEKDIDQDLESSYEKDKITALKKLLALMSRGENVSKYFAKVIKNVASTSFQVRKLVYIYLLKYAEEEPDLSLLSINTFQKDLSDPNPIIRTVALRVLSSIKVPLIIPIMIMAFKKAISDLSPFVRKAVAISLPKCYRMDSTQKESLVEIIQVLLSDKSPIVIGPTISALNEICPVADEWDQFPMIELLYRYSRRHFTDPKLTNGEINDRDLNLFVNNIKRLLYSQNPLIVLVVTNISYDFGCADLKQDSIRALVHTLCRPRQEQLVILNAMKQFIIRDKTYWGKFLYRFAIYENETKSVRNIKLEILNLLVDEENAFWVLNEFKVYSKSPETDFAQKSMQVWRSFALRLPKIAQSTLEILISLLGSSNGNKSLTVDVVVGEAIITIRCLLQSKVDINDESISTERLIGYLVLKYDGITVPLARASILWLIGRHVSAFAHGPDALRISLNTFKMQDSNVKFQIIVLSVLLVLQTIISPDRFDGKITNFIKIAKEYCFKMGAADTDYDIRDQIRWLENSLNTVSSDVNKCKRLSEILTQLPPKPTSIPLHESAFTIGTMSQYFDVEMEGYRKLPDWPTEVLNSDQRVVPETQAWNRDRVIVNELKPVQRIQKTKQRVISLDDFYADVSSTKATPVPSSSGSSESEDSDSDSNVSNK